MKLKEGTDVVDVRAFYIYKSRVGNDLYAVGNDFKSGKLSPLGKQFTSDPWIKSIVINCLYQADINNKLIPTEEIVESSYTSRYAPMKKIYYSKQGESTPFDFIYINGLTPDGDFKVSGLANGINQALFAVKGEGLTLDDITIINFEIERFLAQFKITYIDQEDIELLFNIAVDYVRDERKKASKDK